MSPRPSASEADLERRERELERRERALRVHEEQQRLIGELGSLFTYTIELDADGRPRERWNPGPAAPLAGFSLEEATRVDRWRQSVHPDDLKRVWKLIETARTVGEATTEYRVQAKNGETRWIYNALRKTPAASGGQQLLGIVQDITDLRRTQEALRESELSFEKVFRAAPVVMILSAFEGGRFVDVNDRFIETTGYSREEAIGSTATELGIWDSTEQRDGFREIRRESDGAFEGIEARLHIKSGEAMVALLSAELVTLAGERYMLWHAVDVTRRHEVERELTRYRENLELLVDERTRELEQSRERLRQTERLASIGTLAAGIAHQINNPVGVIMTATQHALDCEADADVLKVWRTALEEAELQARRCARIVRSVLQFSRDQPTQKWPEDLNGAVRRACNLTRSYALERNAEVELHELDAPVPVLVNPIEMEQVLVNVLRNAIESSDLGAQVSAFVECDERFARIRIQDDGPGIADDVAPRVFDPFFTTRMESGGTGLGLSVAHGIVADHGGRIAIENPGAAGCTVCIELPLVRTGEDPTAAA